MNGRRYRIRLYGHTSPEPRKFLKNLAAFLGTDEDEARAVLAQAPVVIKEGLDKDRANVLQEALSLMRALSIIEPMEGEEPGEQAGLSTVDQLLAAYRASSEESTEPWYSRRWVLGGIAGGIVLLLLIGVVMVPGLRKTARHVPVQNPPGRSASPDAGQQRQETYRDWTVEELHAEWDALDRKLEDLTARRAEALQALTALQNTYGADPTAIAEKKQEVADMRFTIKEAQREKMIVERRIRALERLYGPSLSRPPAIEDESSPP